MALALQPQARCLVSGGALVPHSDHYHVHLGRRYGDCGSRHQRQRWRVHDRRAHDGSQQRGYPNGEDGRYQFGLNMRVGGTAAGAGARRDVKIRVSAWRAGALIAAPRVLATEYFRGTGDVEGFSVNMTGFRDLEGADEIRVQAQAVSGSPSFNFSVETSGFWISKVQPPLIVAAEGQQSEGASNNGSTFVRVYRAQSASTTPADPPDPYSGGEYVESFSPWTTDPPTLGSGEVLWVANGGTVLDSSNSVQNRAWQKYPTLTEQYSRHPAENNTYTLDPDEAGRPWVRSLLPSGWGPWSRRDGGGSGWIDLLTDVAAHHATDRLAVLTHTLPATASMLTTCRRSRSRRRRSGRLTMARTAISGYTGTCSSAARQVATGRSGTRRTARLWIQTTSSFRTRSSEATKSE